MPFGVRKNSVEAESLFIKYEKILEKIGIAFQIKDDILDVTSSTEVLGKNAKSDIENDKTNYISLFGIEKCINLCESLTNECLSLLESINGDTKALSELTNLLVKRKY